MTQYRSSILFITILISCCFFPFCYSDSNSDQEKPINVGIASANLSLQAPVEVLEVVFAHDGGTIGITFFDAEGKKYQFCLDGQIDSETNKSLYEGALHPTHEDASLLAQASEKEISIIFLLQTWLDCNFSKQALEELLALNTVSGLTNIKFNAKKVFSVIDIVKQRDLSNEESTQPDIVM